MSEKKLRGLLGLEEKVSGRKQPSLYRDVPGEFDSINQGLLGMMPFAGMTQPGRWFHGTPVSKKIDKFSDPVIDGLKGQSKKKGAAIDTLIGTHAAKDTNVSNKFAMGLFRKVPGQQGSYGQTIPLKIEGAGYQVPQKKTKEGWVAQSDAHSIAMDVANRVFKKSKDLFKQWLRPTLMHRGYLSDKQMDVIWHKLKAGKRVEFPKSKGHRDISVENFSDLSHKIDPQLFGKNSTSKLRFKIVDAYRKDLREKGYSHITYENTAMSEVGLSASIPLGGKKVGVIPKAENDTAAIILDQSKMKPAFGRGLIK